jgi:hypothetical protein
LFSVWSNETNLRIDQLIWNTTFEYAAVSTMGYPEGIGKFISGMYSPHEKRRNSRIADYLCLGKNLLLTPASPPSGIRIVSF